MVMGDQHPLDLLDADLAQVVQHAAVADVDQQGRLALAEHVDVADVLPDQQLDARLLGQRDELALLRRQARRRGLLRERPRRRKRPQRRRDRHPKDESPTAERARSAAAG